MTNGQQVTSLKVDCFFEKRTRTRAPFHTRSVLVVVTWLGVAGISCEEPFVRFPGIIQGLMLKLREVGAVT